MAERKHYEELYAERERSEIQRVKEIHKEQERRYEAEEEEELRKKKMREEVFFI